MGRAKWKGPFVDLYTLTKKKIYPNLWLRSSVIPNRIVDSIVCVHNGREFRRVVITKEKVGFKLGEFSFTRRLRFKKFIKKSKSKNSSSKKAIVKKPAKKSK
jgi:small subunit ribosomal protein S19